MNDIIIFDGHDVEILNVDGTGWDGKSEAWFVPKQIAAAIGASEPKDYAIKTLKRNPEKFEGFKTVVKLSTVTGKRETTIINEQGMYLFLFASELPKAVQFQRRVAELLEKIRQGKVQLQQQTDLKDLKVMEMEARVRNAKARQGNLLLKIVKDFGNEISSESKQVVLSHATELVAGQKLIALPKLESKHYTATEIAKECGLSAQKIGKLATKHELKTEENGKWVLDKAKYSDKQVRNFIYNENGKKKLIEAIRYEIGM